MTARIAVFLATGLYLTTPLAAQAVASGPVSRGTLSFDGHGTGGDFVGRTDSVSGAMENGATLADVRGHVEALVHTLLTGNDHRDRDLNSSMESTKYPTIRFDLKTVRVTQEVGDSASVVLGGDFTIHGVVQPAELKAVVVRRGETVEVRASTPLNLKDYKIGGLKKMLGILSMDEMITVHVDVTFSAGGN